MEIDVDVNDPYLSLWDAFIGENMFGTVMTHHIIRERMSLVELLEREHDRHVSNTEFEGIFF